MPMDNTSIALSSELSGAEAEFLKLYCESGDVNTSLKSVGWGKKSLYSQSRSPVFLAEFRRIKDQYMYLLEDEAFRRAYKGVKEAVYHGGKVVGYQRKPSDRLLMFLLKAHNPDKYDVGSKGKVGVKLTRQSMKLQAGPLSIDFSPNDKDDVIDVK